MSRKCPVSGKGPQSGNKRSKSMIATRRKWNTNLQTHTMVVDGRKVKVRMSAHAYRSLLKSH